ncbi:Ig-like domain-containing protein [Lachnoclostridium phytofermentans]|uniref:Ig domain protein group 2 domain protein n=1 Tax=Lachnoclostridium phytofermentans (strain ATCC 700394 / DSM 18823 / ISDg) TaxID=357809 RepID=A9KHX9_LACP7|nr:Ig-like domain-containing protein [Lachnoclostridium phytofermentans]ABX43826.1 Ig domain protein group 2 domain protein [Lachnoclostridium phytofermentans ISDg]
MKKRNARFIAIAVMLAVMFSTIAVSQPVNTYAATIALNATSKTVVVGNTYTLSINNATNMSKTTWKSSNIKIATVNGKGLVTPVTAGTATITATVYFKDGTQKQLDSKVTVKKRIPATGVELNVVYDEINAHIIEVGGKYDFDTKLTPATSTDSTFYSISDTTYATVDSAGIVTGKKPGITVLEARIGLNKTEAMKSTNTVVARTYILIRPKSSTTPTPTATPKPTPVAEPKAIGVTLISSQEILVNFNCQLSKSSIIDKNGNLISGAITITPGNGATPVGNLSAKLSDDMSGIHIMSSGEFSGTYVVTVFNKVNALDGTPVQATSFQNDFEDTIGPMYTETKISDDGYQAKIYFNEAVDVSELKILKVQGDNDTVVQTYLGDVRNYSLSADKKYLIIDLRTIGKKVVDTLVEITGVKDLKGNAAIQFPMSVVVKCDASEKPLAGIVKVERINKTILEATFSKPIQMGGYAKIDGATVYGSVVTEDNTKVQYTIPNQALTGTQSVTFTGWYNYNASYSSMANQSIAVNFTLDKTPPNLMAYELTSVVENKITVNKLVLTFDKIVSLTNVAGAIEGSLYGSNGNISSNGYAYTGTVTDKVVTLTFTNKTLEAGTYTFNIPKDFVIDNLGNGSLQQSVQIIKSAGSSTALPAPVSIVQDVANPSKIRVTFNNKLDIASATNVSNYILGSYITPFSAVILEQNDTKAVVELTFQNGVISTTGSYAFKVLNVKGYNGTYSEMKQYNTVVTLTENTTASIISCKQTSAYCVEIVMSKQISGTGTFQVFNGTSLVNVSSTFVNGNTIYVAFKDSIPNASYLLLISNYFVDNNGNPVSLGSPIMIQKAN